MNRTQPLAIALIVIGAGIVVAGSAGFSALSADRTVSLDTADDQDGFLGIADNSASDAANITDNSSASELYGLDNNTDAVVTESDVAATIQSWGGDSTARGNLTAEVTADTESTGALGEHDFAVLVTCTSDDIADERGTMTVALELDAGGLSIEATRTTGETITIDCA